MFLSVGNSNSEYFIHNTGMNTWYIMPSCYNPQNEKNRKFEKEKCILPWETGGGGGDVWSAVLIFLLGGGGLSMGEMFGYWPKGTQ